jgi:hypothetical protein
MITVQIKANWHPKFPNGGYAQKKSITDLSKLLGITRNTFYKYLKEKDKIILVEEETLIDKEIETPKTLIMKQLIEKLDVQILQNEEMKKILSADVQEKLPEPSYGIPTCEFLEVIERKLGKLSGLYIPIPQEGTKILLPSSFGGQHLMPPEGENDLQKVEFKNTGTLKQKENIINEPAWGYRDKFKQLTYEEKIKSETFIIATWGKIKGVPDRLLLNHPTIDKLEFKITQTHDNFNGIDASGQEYKLMNKAFQSETLVVQVRIHLLEKYKDVIKTCQSISAEFPSELAKEELKIYMKMTSLGLIPNGEKFESCFYFHRDEYKKNFNKFVKFLDKLWVTALAEYVTVS